ncbi:leucine-rich repeat domain-containing protein [Agarilytica rhodophyticola]|uniref:leucine-rich repeat domain-containing protein n=1 Tax=Agarilytica rhodophyticola TaxID=1737490 RepID=UPI000B341BEC|nr:leucine-rich repeat domain-containing protein [Agarilytica rhodophyticola]
MLPVSLQSYVSRDSKPYIDVGKYDCSINKNLVRLLLQKNVAAFSVILKVAVVCLFAQLSWADEAVIKDGKLRQCLEKIGKKNNWQTPSQFTEVVCHNKNIESLEGLSHYKNLVKISLHKNKINIFDGNNFSALRTLNLGRNTITTINLQSLPELEELYLFKNKITSLSLKNLPKLKKLKANSNLITEFSYQALPELNKIYLFDNEMEHIDIYSLPSMKYMDVRQNPMPDELYEEMDELNGITILHDGNADDWN